MGRIHPWAVTNTCVQTRRRGAAGEIETVAFLALAEALHGRAARSQFCRSTVHIGAAPAGSMADLSVAKRIVKAAGRCPGRRSRSWRGY